MINTDKSTQKPQNFQIAGILLGDYNGEFIGNHLNKTVVFIQNGQTVPWNYISKDLYNKCRKKFLGDSKALLDLSKQNLSFDRQLEIFIYHLYGDVDNTPDFLNGELTGSENNRHSKDCYSLDWNSKWITIDGIKLTNRDLLIIDFIKEDLPDKTIAAKMKIALSTFDFHKRNLFRKIKVVSKTALLIKVNNQHV